jgi:hypothetical protein
MPAVDSLQPGNSRYTGVHSSQPSASSGAYSVRFAAVLVGDADVELVHPVEDVELGDAQAADAVDRHRTLERHDVHPAAAARTTGGGAVFLAAVADALADLVVQFGRERAAADARRVGLGDAEHVVDRVRAHAGAGQRAADGGVATRSRTDRCRGRCRAASPARPRTAPSSRPCAGRWRMPATSAFIGSTYSPNASASSSTLLVIDGIDLEVLGQHEVVVVAARRAASRRVRFG